MTPHRWAPIPDQRASQGGSGAPSSAGLAHPPLTVKGHGWSVAWLTATRSHAPLCGLFRAPTTHPRRPLDSEPLAGVQRAGSPAGAHPAAGQPAEHERKDNQMNSFTRTHQSLTPRPSTTATTVA